LLLLLCSVLCCVERGEKGRCAQIQKFCAHKERPRVVVVVVVFAR